MTVEVQVDEQAGVQADEREEQIEAMVEQADQMGEMDPRAGEKGLSSDDIDRISVAINHWHMHGYPEKAAVLTECLNQDRMPPANLIYFGDIQPETTVDPQKLEIPPRYGQGASAEAWRDFAKQTTDMEPEILEKMARKDLISMLEVKGVIPMEDPASKPDYRAKKKPAGKK